MNKPHWEKLHDSWCDDFRFWIGQRWAFILMLRKHPNHVGFKMVIKHLDLLINKLQIVYKGLYGTRFNTKEIKREVENGL